LRNHPTGKKAILPDAFSSSKKCGTLEAEPEYSFLRRYEGLKF